MEETTVNDAQSASAIERGGQAASNAGTARRSSFPRARERATTVLVIGAGGLLGANARYHVGLWIADRWSTSFPWGTLLINVTGSLLLGAYLTFVSERKAGRLATRLFIATGFLGGYTTFSTFSYEAVQLVRDGKTGLAIAYVVATLVLGLAAVAAGVSLTRRR